MTTRMLRFVLTLGALIGVGLFLSAAGAPDAAAEQQRDGSTESTSPSQEARAKINTIRANEFFYQSYGKSDPFRSLVTGDYEGSEASEVVDVNSASLVGVMWGEADRFALVEDGEGFGYILRVGDRVRNGCVVSIRKNALTAKITLYGITNSVVLKLDKQEGR